jgi:L-fuconolactonase
MSKALQTASMTEPRVRAPRIDAHHHLWRYNKAEFAWIGDEMALLRRDFLVPDLLRATGEVAIDATIVVQARQTRDETDWLLSCAESTPSICGVVGWAPLTEDKLAGELDRLADRNKLVGFREIVQAEPDGYMDRHDFNRGIAQLNERDLTYDILIHERQLEEAIRLVERHPRQRFVLDHMAKPLIARGELEPWGMRMQELAKRGNVACKVSGMVTEANWSRWSLEDLRPYLDLCVAAFGVERLMAGSDWPVCLLGSGYQRWWDTLGEYFAGFSQQEVNWVFGGAAASWYQISDIPSSSVEVSL